MPHKYRLGIVLSPARAGNSGPESVRRYQHAKKHTGAPRHEPIVGSGPFVMNAEAEIVQACQDVTKGRSLFAAGEPGGLADSTT